MKDIRPNDPDVVRQLYRVFADYPSMTAWVHEHLVVPTQRTGREHGAMLCERRDGGLVLRSITGTAKRIDIAHACRAGETPILFIHSHPVQCEDVAVSSTDRRLASEHSLPICVVSGRPGCQDIRLRCYAPMPWDRLLRTEDMEEVP